MIPYRPSDHIAVQNGQSRECPDRGSGTFDGMSLLSKVPPVDPQKGRPFPGCPRPRRAAKCQMCADGSHWRDRRTHWETKDFRTLAVSHSYVVTGPISGARSTSMGSCSM